MTAKLLRGSVEILLRASSNDCRVLHEKVSALFGAMLLVKRRPPRFSSQRCYGFKQPSILASAEMKLLVKFQYAHRVVFCDELVVEPFSRPQDR
jgi:hypothetical protein